MLIADDHALFRRGLRTVLELDGDIVIVGEADDGMAAVEKAEATVPDVVLMDVRMPRCGGIEACQAIRERVPSARIVMLTMSDEESDLFEAVRAGANGYVLKDALGQLAIVLVVSVALGAAIATGLGALVPAEVPFSLQFSSVLGSSATLIALGMLGSMVSVRRIVSIDPVVALGTES